MKILLTYQQLIDDALKRHCDSGLPAHRRIGDEACRALGEFRALVRKAQAATDKNRQLVDGLVDALGEAERNRTRPGEDAWGPKSIKLENKLKTEISALRSLEAEIKGRGAASAEDRATRQEEVARAWQRRIDKEFELYTKVYAPRSEALNALLRATADTVEIVGLQALLIAAIKIAQQMPDSLTVWAYHKHQARLRLQTTIANVKRRGRKAEKAVTLLGLLDAMSQATAAAALLVKAHRLIDGREVASWEDIEALLAQRPALERYVAAIEQQRRALAPLSLAAKRGEKS